MTFFSFFGFGSLEQEAVDSGLVTGGASEDHVLLSAQPVLLVGPESSVIQYCAYIGFRVS